MMARSAVQTPARSRGGLHVSERKVLLVAADLVLLNLALLAVLAWRMREPFAAATVASRAGWFALLSFIWAAVAALSEVYDLRRAARLPAGVVRPVTAVLVADLLYLAVPYYTPYLHASRLTVLSFLAATAGLVAAWRTLYAVVLVQPSFRHPVLILGAGPAGREILSVMRAYGETEYLPVGFVDGDPALRGQEVDGIPVWGQARDLAAILGRTDASEVVVALPPSEGIDGDLFQTLVDCHERGITVTPMYRLFEQLTGQVPIEHAGRNLSVVLPLDRTPPVIFDAVKRLLDLLLGAVGLAFMAVVTPLAALALWLEDRGPAFYRQRRVGRGGREFVLLKFRTMTPDAEATGPQWADVGDARVTRVGRVLRRLHLDELPQAVNILRGEMSVVGPRPERPEFVAALQTVIPYYRTRLSVRPGVTGWAQVNFEYGDSVEDALVKLRYDLYYVKHRSMVLDLLILIRTLGHVLRRGGR
ncbi:MAG: sugar transferase [Armatimonadota bacterium]|nr:sugar transferase [Armatimonadota bacterium]MDR7519572.1 sugar transferase [Armatimonadota bacterium]MDR7550143.1 sugar transferase [Armatimonadota bacterium]